MSTLAQNAVALQRPQAARYMTATSTFVPTEAMVRAAYDAFEASNPLIQNVAVLSWVVNIEPLPPQLYAHDNLHDNVLGLTRKNETLVVYLVSPSWTDLAQDEVVYKAAQSIIADIDARAKVLGAYDSYIYLNHAGPWQQVISSYGEENVAKLQSLRKRIDPGGLFRRRGPGGFKMPESA